MSVERNSGNIDFGMSIGVTPEVNVTGAEYDRKLEETEARERLADVMNASETPVTESTPAPRHERLTGAAILELVSRRSQNLEITRKRTAGTNLEKDAA